MLPGSMSGLSKAMVMQLRKMKTRTTWSNILCAMTFWQETRSLRRQPRSEDPQTDSVSSHAARGDVLGRGWISLGSLYLPGRMQPQWLLLG